MVVRDRDRQSGQPGCVCARVHVCVCVCVARGAEAGERRRGKLAGQHRHVLGPLKTVPRVDNMYKCYV